MKEWQNLSNPPIAVALFQIKYIAGSLKLSDFTKFDLQLKNIFPIRKENVQVGINFGDSKISLGTSKISGTTDAKIDTYIYLTKDQKKRFEISNDTISYIDENQYSGWANFKEDGLKALTILTEILNSVTIIRTSIRFINKFTFDNFDNPQDYFKTLISSAENQQLPYSLSQYGFRLMMTIPDSDIYAVVNQNVENIKSNSYVYVFDIDVLDRQDLLFDTDTLSLNLDKLREIKNEIFYNNLTQKTLDLCN